MKLYFDLKTQQKKKGYTSYYIGKKTGLTLARVNQLLLGDSLPNLIQLGRLCELFECDVTDLIKEYDGNE